MNQQEFEKIFENLTVRRKELLLKVLAGETDVAIAKAMGIGKPTVRKYIERISLEFGLEKEHSDERRYKRSDLIALFAKFKPELLREQAFTNAQKVASAEILEIKDTNAQGKAVPTTFVSAKQIEKNVSINENSLLKLPSGNISAQEYLENAQEYLENQLKLSSDEEKTKIAKSLNKIGYDYYIDGYFQHAVFYLKWAITFNPDFGNAYYNLGSAYEKLGNLSSACHNYEIATSYSSPAADAAINNLARLKILQGNSAAAAEIIKAILLRVQDSKVKASLCKNLGWAYFEQKLYKKAKKYLLMSLELDSERALTHCLLAKVQEAEGEKQSALVSWKNCLKYDPSSQQAKVLDSKLPELYIWKLEARRALGDEGK
jgi:tetratricopeptide (TPR) repeat protein